MLTKENTFFMYVEIFSLVKEIGDHWVSNVYLLLWPTNDDLLNHGFQFRAILIFFLDFFKCDWQGYIPKHVGSSSNLVAPIKVSSHCFGCDDSFDIIIIIKL